MKTFEDFRINLEGRSGVEVQTTCPQCSPSRRKAKARCLSVNTVDGVWLCHHCDWRGSLNSGEEAKSRTRKRLVRPTFVKPSRVEPAVLEWFTQRRIPEAIVARHGIALQTIYLPQIE